MLRSCGVQVREVQHSSSQPTDLQRRACCHSWAAGGSRCRSLVLAQHRSHSRTQHQMPKEVQRTSMQQRLAGRMLPSGAGSGSARRSAVVL